MVVYQAGVAAGTEEYTGSSLRYFPDFDLLFFQNNESLLPVGPGALPRSQGHQVFRAHGALSQYDTVLFIKNRAAPAAALAASNTKPARSANGFPEPFLNDLPGIGLSRGGHVFPPADKIHERLIVSQLRRQLFGLHRTTAYLGHIFQPFGPNGFKFDQALRQ